MSLFRRNKRAREERDEAAAAAPGLAGADAYTDPAELDALVGEAPGTRRRGRLRRRLRHLRRVREVLLRDLGGMAFELHRSGAGEGGPVLEGKLARLTEVDHEIRDLEDYLIDHRGMIVREPGIGGTCAECGEIFGSEARFCWACGNPVAVGAGGAPHLAAWTTHPQITSGGQPTAPLPQMEPGTVQAEQPAANEPATGDVGGEGGAQWSEAHVDSSAEEETAPEAEPERPSSAADWLPPEEEPPVPPLSSGDPLARPPRQAGQ